GISLPVYFAPRQARVAGAGIRLHTAESDLNNQEAIMEEEYRTALNHYVMARRNIYYYQQHLLGQASSMITRSLKAFQDKKINYIEYLELISRSLGIERNYLQLILDNNLAVIQLEYFLSK